MKMTLMIAVMLLAAPAALAQTSPPAAPPTRLEQVQVFTEELAKRESSIIAKGDQIASLQKKFSMGNPPMQRIEYIQTQEIAALEAVAEQFFGRHVAVMPPVDTQASIIAKATAPLQTNDDDVVPEMETKIRWRLSWHHQREIKLGLKHLHEELDLEAAKAKAAVAVAPTTK